MSVGKNESMRNLKNKKGTFVRLLRYVKHYRLWMALALGLCLVSNVMVLMGPVFAGKAIAEAAAGAGKVKFDRVLHYARYMMFFYVASSLLILIINYIMMHVGRWVGRQMRQDIFDKLMKLPIRFFDQNAAGDIISHVSYDVDVVCVCISTDIVQIMTNLVTVIGSLFMMIYISRVLVLSMAVTIPLAVLYTRYMGKTTRPLFSKRSLAFGEMNGCAEELFSGQKTILAYAQKEFFQNKFEKANTCAAEAFYHAGYYGKTIGPTTGCINNLGLSMVGILGALLYMYGIVSLEHISSFVLYSRKFTSPINEIANIINEIYSALSASERIFELLDQQEEPRDREGAVELEHVHGDVEFQDVSFGYVPGNAIINHFDLKVDSGKIIAIVGPTGAGKTTIINLLMRFYDVDRGEIFVDRTQICDATRSSLRRVYAMVLQDTWLFSGTIFDNIAYGREGAAYEEVIAAAKAANVHHYIMQLQNGYETIITDGGKNISKGQKQLLTIARAMLYDSQMLILDEATSNVDTNTERQIQTAMLDLMADRTCFVIAHRLSTIRNADRILVVDHGNIVEQGTHRELMNKKGLYYKMYMAQFE